MSKLHELAQLGQSIWDDNMRRALLELRDKKIMARIWAHDHTVWKNDPAEISNRLGWLHSPEVMAGVLPQLDALVEAVLAEGYSNVLLLGMGGSSLAPELFSKVWGDGQLATGKQGLKLSVLDSTDPAAVLAQAEGHDPARTLYIVSTKSGGTVETFSFFKYFYNQVAGALGADRAGDHFIAITDPGSALAELAGRFDFRTTFLNDPNIGGRYSALSYFGLVPAALVGVDVARLLERAMTAAGNAESANCPVDGDNRAARLGVIMAELAKAGRDKLTIITSPEIASFGDWVEQLIAESTGKEGQGIVPVVGEPLGPPEVYGDDRLFVYLRLEGQGENGAQRQATTSSQLRALEDAGHPVVEMTLYDLYDLGDQMFLWEMATAVAGYSLAINPFDQPNVESAKVLTRQMVAAYQQEGKLPELEPTLRANGLVVYSALADGQDQRPASPGAVLDAFLDEASAGDYLSLQAYVQPTAETDAALTALRHALRNKTRLATTLGYGPRFLHSTGQLHKGDAGNGRFIQFTSDSPEDVPIPDKAGSSASTMTFGILEAAQALGDRQALLDAGRPVLRFHLGADVVGGLQQLAATSR